MFKRVRAPGRAMSVLTDQAIVAAANAGVTLGALALTPRGLAGLVMLGTGLAYMWQALGRSVVGDLLLIQRLSAKGDLEAAVGSALSIGLTGTLVGALLWLCFAPSLDHVGRASLVVIVVSIPGVLVQDASRFALIALDRERQLVGFGVVMLGAQGAVSASLILIGVDAAIALTAGWGVGYIVGAILNLRSIRVSLSLRWPWTRSTSAAKPGWYLASSVVGQAYGQLVNVLLASLLSLSALAAIRGSLTIIFQPAHNLGVALLSQRSRAYARQLEDGGIPFARQFRRSVLREALTVLALSVPLGAISGLLGGHVLAQIGSNDDLIVPLAVFGCLAGFHLAQMPILAALRALRAGRQLALHATASGGVSLLLVWMLTLAFDVAGAIGGLLIGTMAGLCVAALLMLSLVSGERISRQ